MSAVNSNYETIFIVNVTAGDEAVAGVVEKFKTLISANGEITAVDEWGKRKLAYPIDDMTEGYYVLVNFTAPANFIAELERIYNITEEIMRSIVIAKDKQ